VLVDVDKYEGLTERFDVKAYPTIVSWNGTREIGRTSGGLDVWGIDKAWKKSGERVSRSTPSQTRRYRARWTFPGETREDLIDHLNGSNHNYTRQSLNRMSTDDLFRLHDSDHEGVRNTRSRSTIDLDVFGLFTSDP
jgi:hypothetical protein